MTTTAMAATPSTVHLSTTRITISINNHKQQSLIPLHRSLTRKTTTSHSLGLSASFRVAASGPPTPPNISEKVSESIKAAEQACAEDATSGECAAAWDEVEELSAAASHARDKLKVNSDPLEAYCKDNPETEECRTYED